MVDEYEPYLSEEQKKAADNTRQCLLNNNIEIPEMLDTDFEMYRWWVRWYKNNDGTELVQKFSEYIRNRRVLGFDRSDFVDTVWQRPLVEKYLPYVPVNKLGAKLVNKISNSVVLLLSLRDFNMVKMIEIMKMSDWVQLFFTFAEYYHQLVLDREKKTGKRSCTQVISDFYGVRVQDYILQSSAFVSLATFLGEIWQGYFHELITLIVCVNPPGMISLVYSLAKVMITPENQKRILIGPSECTLFEYFDEAVVPKAFGGTLIDNTPGSNPELCIAPAKQITEWTKLELMLPQLNDTDYNTKHWNGSIKTGVSQSKSISLHKNDMLRWQFSTDFEAHFSIYYDEPAQEYAYPAMLVGTPKIPENDWITVDRDCTVVLTIKNKQRVNFLGRARSFSCLYQILPPLF